MMPAPTQTRPSSSDELATPSGAPSTDDDVLADPLSSVAVLGSSGQTEVSFDGLFTQRLVGLLDSGRSLDEAMDALASEEQAAQGGDQSVSQAPAIARLGAGGPSEGGTKKAMLIGNKNYVKSDSGGKKNIPTAKTDAKGLAGSLGAQGYAAETAFDRSAKEMGDLYKGAVEDSELTAGDAVVLYFSGHGTPLGPVGVGGTYDDFHDATAPASYEAGTIPNQVGDEAKSPEEIKGLLAGVDFSTDVRDEAPILEHEAGDILPNSTFTSLVSTASAKGVHLRIILDACFSGRTTDMVRDEFLSGAAEGATGGSPRAEGAAVALDLDGWKETLTAWRRASTLDGDTSRTWRDSGFPEVKALIGRFNALTGEAIAVPEAGLDLVDDIAKIHKQIDDALNAMIAALQRMRDAEED